MMLPRRALGVLAFAFFGSAANAAAAPISVAYTDPVTNWEWAEVAELKNLFSWDDVNTVCAEDGVTACAGTLEEKEFDGWIWATSDQVSDLFVNATDDLTAAMLGGGLAQVFDSPWAPQFLGLFSPTFEDPVSDWVVGWTADIDPNDATRAYTAFIKDSFPPCAPNCLDNLDIAATTAVSNRADPLLGGVWLHRPAETAVVTPEPASMLLLGSGLLVGIRRYRKNRS